MKHEAMCPQCGMVSLVDYEEVGRVVTCNGCGNAIKISLKGSVELPPAPLRASRPYPHKFVDKDSDWCLLFAFLFLFVGTLTSCSGCLGAGVGFSLIEQHLYFLDGMMLVLCGIGVMLFSAVKRVLRKLMAE